MNDEIKFTNKVRQALNEGARVDGRVAARLLAARERALEAHRAAPVEVRTFAATRTRSALGLIGSFGGLGGFALRAVLPTVILLAGLVGIYGWQERQRAADVEELDAMLLTDDLPMDAYLDRGFETWLKKVSSDSGEER